MRLDEISRLRQPLTDVAASNHIINGKLTGKKINGVKFYKHDNHEDDTVSYEFETEILLGKKLVGISYGNISFYYSGDNFHWEVVDALFQVLDVYDEDFIETDNWWGEHYMVVDDWMQGLESITSKIHSHLLKQVAGNHPAIKT